jgi:DNA-binding IclR family transcriptional regulator
LSTADRVLNVLSLFSMAQPEWTIEAAAKSLGLGVSTAYRYFHSLVDAGLLVNYAAGRYVIGPAIIQYDRQARHFDPLIRSAAPVLADLAGSVPSAAAGLLCRIYRSTVMCVDQAANPRLDFAVSYERGRPMPLFKGAASLAITAQLPSRTLKQYFLAQTPEGIELDELRARLRQIRKQGYALTRGEVDPGMTGISAPIFNADNEALASIGLVIRSESLDGALDALCQSVREAGIKVTGLLRRQLHADGAAA